jgi:hypothetical protein
MIQPCFASVFPSRMMKVLPTSTPGSITVSNIKQPFKCCIPHRHISLSVAVKVGRLCECAVVRKEIQERAPLDKEVNPNGTAAPASYS